MSDVKHTAPVNIIAAGAAGTATLPEVVVFQHRNWEGWSYRTNLNVSWVGSAMNDEISGIIVVSGTWRFHEHRDFAGQSWDLGPGYYEYIADFGIPNDIISSFQCIRL